MINPSFNAAGFQFKLKKIDELIAGDKILNDLRAPVELIYKNAIYNTLGETGNGGQRWKPRKPRLGKNGVRADTHKLLQETGFMRQTTRAEVEADSIVVSTKADYAKYHITGTNKMVARPTNGVDAKVERVIAANVAKIINETR